jgi:hypothetical protein
MTKTPIEKLEEEVCKEIMIEKVSRKSSIKPFYTF